MDRVKQNELSSRILQILATENVTQRNLVVSMGLSQWGPLALHLRDPSVKVGVRSWTKVAKWLEQYDKGEVDMGSLQRSDVVDVGHLVSLLQTLNLSALSRASGIRLDILRHVKHGRQTKMNHTNYKKLKKAVYEQARIGTTEGNCR